MIDSVVGWLAPSEKLELQVSIIVAPPSTAAIRFYDAKPEVA